MALPSLPSNSPPSPSRKARAPSTSEKFPDLLEETACLHGGQQHQQHPGGHFPHHLAHHHPPAPAPPCPYPSQSNPPKPSSHRNGISCGATAVTPISTRTTTTTTTTSASSSASASASASSTESNSGPAPAFTTNPGRPPSLSLQSVASSSSSSSPPLSDCSSASEVSLFDSRRSSLIITASSAFQYQLQYQCQNQHQTEHYQHHFDPQSVSHTTRNRKDAKQLHAARLQRSGSTSLAFASKKEGSKGPRHRRFQRAHSSPADALAAIEPPHEQGLTRMAYTEQQRWITVQQKTFTKWLNTKIEVRNLEVKDLVQDLSDGVRTVGGAAYRNVYYANRTPCSSLSR